LAELLAVVTAVLSDFGFRKTAMAMAFCLDFFGLKNEPGSLRFEPHSLHFVQVVQGDGGGESGLRGGDAFSFYPGCAATRVGGSFASSGWCDEYKAAKNKYNVGYHLG
jgi:hypothetical protein